MPSLCVELSQITSLKRRRRAAEDVELKNSGARDSGYHKQEKARRSSARVGEGMREGAGGDVWW